MTCCFLFWNNYFDFSVNKLECIFYIKLFTILQITDNLISRVRCDYEKY